MPVADLSRTSRQAKQACQALGLAHPWADWLDVVQNNGPDWARESSLSDEASAEVSVMTAANLHASLSRPAGEHTEHDGGWEVRW